MGGEACVVSSSSAVACPDPQDLGTCIEHSRLSLLEQQKSQINGLEAM